MAIITKIQWCDSSVNPIMGCAGCELFLNPRIILKRVDDALKAQNLKIDREWAKTIFRKLFKETRALISEAPERYSNGLTTSDIYHLRGDFYKEVCRKFGREAEIVAIAELERSITCYAAKLHLNKARCITNPNRQAHKRYAPSFERVTQFPGRMQAMAKAADLYGKHRPTTPWLGALPRLIFVSDMGDAFSRKCDFPFLKEDAMEAIKSPLGKNHLWLWLTKRPARMAEFAEEVGGFPRNLCAMTTATNSETLHRVKELTKVNAHTRGLSIEPLRDRLPPENLDLAGIDWVIVGGESGKRDIVHPFDLKWAEELRDHCRAQGVAFFLKQLGRQPIYDGNPLTLSDAHGGDWTEWPEDLRVREMPEAFARYRMGDYLPDQVG